jgi:predicted deacylase
MEAPDFEHDARVPRASAAAPRLIADLRGRAAGPTLVVTGGLHGNEPAGVYAAERVAERLRELSDVLRGRVVMLRGNRAALARGRRFLVRDLNRGWTAEAVARLVARPPSELGDEDAEQRELAVAIDELERAEGELTFLDLHSTSGESAPFVCFGDTLANRRLALRLPLTAVLGLEEVIDGAMLGLMSDRGHRAIAVECGQHDDPTTVDRHVAAIWICLEALGSLERAAIRDFEGQRALLEQANHGLPPVIEVRHRHVVAPEDDFEMLPGFESFEPIVRGQPVARDKRGEICAPEDGLMLMPRYQGQGEDGYFMARAVAPFWLGVSDWLRRAQAHRLLPLLPGVSRHREHGFTLVVDPTIARSRVTEIMHLFGYRKERPEGGRLLYSRRPSEG